MKQTDTICYKVDQCVKILQHAINTSELNAGQIGEYLHQIRRDAQKMEDGLRERKEMMSKAGIEDLYQTAKGAVKKTGINKIPDHQQITTKKQKFELTIKNGDEIMYQNEVESGVLCAVEDFKGMDDEGHLRGITQTFFFGGIIAYWYAFDQLRQSIEAHGLQISGALRELRKQKGL